MRSTIFQLLLLLSISAAGVSAQTTPATEPKLPPSNDHNIMFAMGTWIEILKVFAEQPNLIAKGFGGMDKFSKMKDVPIYGKHFVELAKYADLTPEKRRSEADKAYTSLKNSLSAKEQWELEAGKYFGAFIGPTGHGLAQNIDRETALRVFGEVIPTLAPLGELVKTPPKDVDPLLLSRLKVLVESTMADKTAEEKFLSIDRAVNDLIKYL